MAKRTSRTKAAAGTMGFGAFSSEIEKAHRHEAGHVVVALALGDKPASVWVRVNERSQIEGKMESEPMLINGYQPDFDLIRRDMAVSWGGYVAERRHSPRDRRRSVAGIQGDRQAIERWNPFSDQDWPSSLSASVRLSAFVKTLADEDRQREEAAWRRDMVIRAFWVARRIIALAMEAVEDLASTLEDSAERSDDDRGEVGGEDLRDFARFYSLRSIGTRATKEWDERARRLKKLGTSRRTRQA
jgi:hypothetical protein